MINKNNLVPGNLVSAGVNKEIIISEIEKDYVCDLGGAKYPYEELDTILLDEAWLGLNGFSHRVLTGGKANYNDWIQQTEGDNFYTITVERYIGCLWVLKIDDSNFVNVLTAKISYVHQLQNLISNIIYV